MRIYEIANQKFSDCLMIKPNDHRALYNWALCLSKQANIKREMGDHVTAGKSIELAYEKYNR